jgi:hypothetical protein
MARKNDESHEEWVEVAAVGDDEEAEIIAGLLKSEGIPALVEGPATTPFPEDLGAFGMSRVMVPPERGEEAKALIATREKEAARHRKPGKHRE